VAKSGNALVTPFDPAENGKALKFVKKIGGGGGN